jgi:DNA-binding LytR/AlgR family response regulator
MSFTTNISIVEDDFLIADFIEKSLLSFGYNVLDICNSYDNFISSIDAHLPDIVLVDIKIDGEKTGIDVGEYLRTYSDIPFVYISSLSDKKTIDAAKNTLPSAYLIKPFEEEDLYAAIEVALMNYAQRKNSHIAKSADNIVLDNAIFIKQKQAFIKVNKADILYLEAKDNYVKIYTKSEAFLIRQTLNEIHQVLPVYFFRVHRSFMVNLHCIEQIRYEEVVLPNNITVPVSRSIYPDLIERVQVLKS